MRLLFIAPAKPVQNASIESVNGRWRDVWRQQHWCVTRTDACHLIEARRRDNQSSRRHRAPGDWSPGAFVFACGRISIFESDVAGRS